MSQSGPITRLAIPRRPVIVSVALSLASVAAGIAMVLVALDRASGVTRIGGTSYRTEFIDYPTYALVWLLVPVLALAAYCRWSIAMLGLLGVTAAATHGMSVTVGRYGTSGWGDGLEVLGYAFPIGLLLVGSIVLAGAGVLGRRVRRRPARQDR